MPTAHYQGDTREVTLLIWRQAHGSKTAWGTSIAIGTTSQYALWHVPLAAMNTP